MIASWLRTCIQGLLYFSGCAHVCVCVCGARIGPHACGREGVRRFDRAKTIHSIKITTDIIKVLSLLPSMMQYLAVSVVLIGGGARTSRAAKQGRDTRKHTPSANLLFGAVAMCTIAKTATARLTPAYPHPPI